MPKRKKRKKLPVLLLEDIPNLGQRGEVVEIKPGYYRYLLSLGKVTLATKERLETELKPLLLTTKIQEREKLAEELKRKIEDLVFRFPLKKLKEKVVSPLTREKILKFLKENGINLSKGQIELQSKITQEGKFEIPINLGYGIKANLKIEVFYEK